MKTLTEALVTGTANAVTGEGSTCPPWCDVEDHDDWDGGEMHHSWGDGVDLAFYPYEVRGAQYHERLRVSRSQVRDNTPVIEIDVPLREMKPTLPSGVSGSGAAILTLEEAAELVAVLQEAIRLGDVPALTG